MLSLVISISGIVIMSMFIANIELGNELNIKESVVVITIIGTGLFYTVGLFGLGVNLLL